MQGWGGSCRGGVGDSYRGGMGHAVKQPKKNVSPQNQDMTPPNSFLEGVQNLSFEYKNYYYYFIITIVLYSQLYKKIITICSLYKNLDGMIIMLVPREKKQKGCLCSQWN